MMIRVSRGFGSSAKLWGGVGSFPHFCEFDLGDRPGMVVSGVSASGMTGYVARPAAAGDRYVWETALGLVVIGERRAYASADEWVAEIRATWPSVTVVDARDEGPRF